MLSVYLHSASSVSSSLATQDTESDVYDLLRGDTAVLEAAKRGDLLKLQRLITASNINCRDTQGRNSAPLHLAAGYNNVEVSPNGTALGSSDMNPYYRSATTPAFRFNCFFV